MNHTVIVSLIVVVLLALSALAWFFLPSFLGKTDFGSQLENLFGFVTEEDANDAPYDNDTTMTIRTTSGASVEVPDFTIDGIRSTYQGESYLDVSPVTESTEVEQSFSLFYKEDTASFLIVLNQNPLDAARIDAESYLEDVVGLSKEDLCGLPIRVVTDDTVHADFSGYYTLGLSFCPNPVALPM